MGMIPKKTKSETKVFKGLTAQRFLGLFMVIMISAMIGSLIGGALQWVFIISSIVVYFILTGKSVTDPTKNFARGLVDFIKFKFETKEFIGPSNHEYIEFNHEREVKNSGKAKKSKRKEKDGTKA